MRQINEVISCFFSFWFPSIASFDVPPNTFYTDVRAQESPLFANVLQNSDIIFLKVAIELITQFLSLDLSQCQVLIY